MVIVANSASPASKGNRPLRLHGIRIALILLLVAAGLFGFFSVLDDNLWHEKHPQPYILTAAEPLWISVLWAVIFLAPFLVSLLLLSRNKLLSITVGAGIAGGSSIFCLVLSPGMWMGLLLGLGLSEAPHARLIALSFLAFLLMSAWLAIAAIWIGKSNWKPFLFTVIATFAGVAYGLYSLDGIETKLSLENEQRRREASDGMFKPVVSVEGQIMSLAGCLLMNHSLRPREGFPTSLEQPPANWFCEAKFSANAVPEYIIGYTPQIDPANGLVKDFHLVALPRQKRIPGRYALMVDSRGIVFSNPLWGETNAYIKAARPEGQSSEIDELRNNINLYINEKGLAAAPATLNTEAIGTKYSFEIPRMENGTRLEINGFALYYLPSKRRTPIGFALSVQCQSYGQNCLRSYFLDYAGVVHGTGEPRQATGDDPVALPCEMKGYSDCRDAAWTHDLSPASTVFP